MTRRYSLLLASLLSLCHAGGALAIDSDIQVSDQSAPSVNQFGIAPEQGAVLSVDDAMLAPLANAKDSLARQPLAQPQKYFYAQLLAAPVTANSIPQNWMQERLSLLNRMQESGTAWRLFTQIPDALMTNEAAQEGIDTGWRLGKTEETCGLVKKYIEKFDDSSWTGQQLLCALLKGDQAKIDFSLTYLEESAPDALSPLLKAIAENRKTLPALSPKDQRILPALLAYYQEQAAKNVPLPEIPQDFISAVPLDALPANLLGWIAQQPAISLPNRCNAAEFAYQRGGLDANGLRQVYQEALRSKTLPNTTGTPAFCTRADILAGIGGAPTPQLRTSALLNAFTELRTFYTDRQTRALLSEEFKELASRLPDPSAPVFLLLQTALTHLETGDRQAAERIASNLGALRTMQGRIAAYAVRQAIAFSVTNAYDTTAPDIDDFPPMDNNDKPETVWHRTRVADVFEALNYPVPPTARGNPFAAPAAPGQQAVDTNLLAMFQQAKTDGRQTAALFYGMQLLGNGHWDMISGATLSQVLSMLKAYGYEQAANRLAVEALLTPPH